ncbi:hypothetical protein Ciccas_012669 [Cichlidogyrus casuarinus]|uniref:Carboxylesterase type B domain-containing protein n=1 Tax=Cichlidogyrus casuarinus TaxID=1844966 RepID=A0ABD2PN86_9PLAT
MTDREQIITCLQRDSLLGEIMKHVFPGDYEKRSRHELLKKCAPNGTSYPYGEEKSGLYFDTRTKPVVDGVFLPKSPTEVFDRLAKGESIDHMKTDGQILMGINKNEAMFFVFYGFDMFREDGQLNSNFDIWKDEDLYWFISSRFLDKEYLTPVAISAVLRDYRFDSKIIDPSWAGDTSSEWQRNTFFMIEQIGSDIDFICPSIEFADKMTSFLPSVPVYMYKFEQQTKNISLPTWVGAMHGYEIEYLFGMPFHDRFQRDFYSFTQAERQMSIKAMQFIGNFARKG